MGFRSSDLRQLSKTKNPFRSSLGSSATLGMPKMLDVATAAQVIRWFDESNARMDRVAQIAVKFPFDAANYELQQRLDTYASLIRSQGVLLLIAEANKVLGTGSIGSTDTDYMDELSRIVYYSQDSERIALIITGEAPLNTSKPVVQTTEPIIESETDSTPLLVGLGVAGLALIIGLLS